MSAVNLPTLGGAAAAWPLAAGAQQPERRRRIGVLMAAAESDPEGQRYIKAFLQGLRKLGWEHSRNAEIELRWGASDADGIQTYAAELVKLNGQPLLGGSGGVSRSD
jgi:hypothetical protein